MTITSITAQLKNPDRYSIFVDNHYAFSLSAAALLESKLIRGQELTQAELAEMQRLSEDDKAYSLTLAYVARRMRSEGELRDYFRRKHYDTPLAENLMERLRAKGYVDDAEFARRWVENRRLLKATSSNKLRFELRQKQVADDIITQVLADDETDERAVLRQLAAKKRQQSRYQDEQKLIAFLGRQGFHYDDIRAVLHGDD